jgi:general stress protein 26
MNQSELLLLLDSLLIESKSALMTTVSAERRPLSRWMTIRTMRNRPGFLYCVCRKSAKKVAHVVANPYVSFLVQDKALTEILTVAGTASIIDSPTLIAEFLETAGKDIFVIWQQSPPPRTSDLTIIETKIEDINHFQPMTGESLDYKIAQ